LAGRIDTVVNDHYEESFEHLSRLPVNPILPSANTLEALRLKNQNGIRRSPETSSSIEVKGRNVVVTPSA